VEDWQAFSLRVLISGGQPITMTVERDGESRTVNATPESVGPNSQGYLGAFPPAEPVVFEVQPDTPAAAAGLLPGDRFVEVEGIPVLDWTDLTRVVVERPNQPTDFIIERDLERFAVTITPQPVESDQGEYGSIGVRREVPTVLQSYGLVGAMGRSVSEIRRQTALIGEILGRLFTGRMSVRTLSGPIEIANYSGAAARTGDPFMLFFFMGVVSLQLGLLNLLPIPVLDGGHIAVLAFEGITRHDLSLKVKENMMKFGVVLLVTLMLVVITFDLLKTFGR
jgi:regulator of sigma E protease